MPRRAPIPTRKFPALFSFFLCCAIPAAAMADARVSEGYGKLPLHFEANQGQTHQDVRFLSRGAGYSLYLTAGEAVLVLTQPNADAKRDGHGLQAQAEAKAQPKSAVLRMGLVGAARKPLVSGFEELPGKANYFIGSDPAKWRANVPTYGRVHYRGVYPGIDLVYYGNQRQLEYDFIVAPGVDPKKIVLGFKGADRLEIDAEGDLVLHAPGGAIRQKKPVIYQEIDGVRQEIAGSYVRRGAKRVGFKVAAYDRSHPLIIDPVLSYSTYLGGGNSDGGSGIAVDAAGNAYVTGRTFSSDFPTTSGAFQPSHPGLAGSGHIFVTKLNPTGTALIYSTHLGGNGRDQSNAIVVDADGNAYVTGSTESTDFPTTTGAFQTSLDCSGVPCANAFVTKLNPAGSALVYSTFLGGSRGANSFAIAVDPSGNAYVTGDTRSTDFPTTAGAFQTSSGGGDCGGGFPPVPCPDAFVTKLDATGSGLVYSTYLGGSSSESGSGIAVDASGNAYVTGGTNSPDFPTTPGAFETGNRFGFVSKLNPSGTALVYSTTSLGGAAIAVDVEGNAYVTGSTNSTDFPTTPGAAQPNYGGGPPNDFGHLPTDAFVTKLNPTGSALVYSTYLGASGSDFGSGIAVDAAGNAYVIGGTGRIFQGDESQACTRFPCINDFPTTPGSFQPVYGGGSHDAFVTKLDPTGSALVYSTYLGGSSGDSGSEIVVAPNGNAYVTGHAGSSNFPTTSGAFQSTSSGGDAFVAKINFPTRFEESAATYTGFWPSYGAETGTFSGGTIVASNQATATATFSFTGTGVSWIGVKCNVCGIATVSIDGGAPTTVNTFGPGVPGSLTSEPVFSASGLAPDVTHTLAITVTGATASLLNLLPGNGHVAVDAFDVTR